jgi:cytidylate kinase
MKRVITIGGLHGTGKSSTADKIAENLGLRRASAGKIFRQMAAERCLSLEEFSKVAEEDESIDLELDGRLKDEAAKGGIALDGQLAAWMAGENADFKILLTAPDDVRIKRIAQRDGVDIEHARHETLTREKIESTRYLEFYKIDVSDLTIYDLILNTEKYTLEGVVRIIITAIRILWNLSDI